MSTRFTIAQLAASCSFLLALAAHAAEIEGTQATLQWTSAAGPVSGYYVVVSRNAAPAEVEAVSLDTTEVVEGAAGDTLTVQVAAFSDDGVAGPLSQPSDPISFVAGGDPGGDPGDGGGGGGGGGGDDGDPSGGGDGGGSGSGAPSVRSDFSGDGYADLLVRTDTSLEIWALEASHVARTLLLPLPSAGAKLAAIGDFDGNGSADLLWKLADGGDLEVWQLDGGVITATRVLDRSTAPSADGWKVAGTADFDADGGEDLVLWNASRGEVQLWMLDATGVASRTEYGSLNSRWKPEVVPGVGSGAIIWHDPVEGTLHASNFAGDVFMLGEVGTGWNIVDAANLDGRGVAEVLLEDAVSGALQAWTLASGALSMVAEVPPGPAGSARAAHGDYDGDGREDLAWSDPATGVVTFLYGDAFAVETVDRSLPAGAAILGAGDDGDPSGGSCEADLNGDGTANGGDARHLRACLRLGLVAGCEGVDLNADGVLNTSDLKIFKDLTRASGCQ